MFVNGWIAYSARDRKWKWNISSAYISSSSEVLWLSSMVQSNSEIAHQFCGLDYFMWL